jgi:hypothetical protein
LWTPRSFALHRIHLLAADHADWEEAMTADALGVKPQNRQSQQMKVKPICCSL